MPPGFPVQSLMASSQVLRTREDNGVFHVTPNMGTLPPHQSVEFILEFAPREVSCSWRKKAFLRHVSRFNEVLGLKGSILRNIAFA